MSYPKFLYHKELGSRLLKSEKEEAELEKGWVDTPEKFKLDAAKISLKKKTPPKKKR